LHGRKIRVGLGGGLLEHPGRIGSGVHKRYNGVTGE
jgi:hypothetical protein